MSEYGDLSVSARQELRNSVRRGVRLLDRMVPSWYRKIDLNKFNLQNTKWCVLGQVYGEFGGGLKELAEEAIQKLVGKLEFVDDIPEISAEYYGFNVPNQSNSEYEYTGQMWVRAIQARRIAAKTAPRKKAKK